MDNYEAGYNEGYANGYEACFQTMKNKQPLQDGDIGKILDKLNIGASMTDWMIKFARQVEKSHGIGE
jgi:hypothetical protein